MKKMIKIISVLLRAEIIKDLSLVVPVGIPVKKIVGKAIIFSSMDGAENKEIVVNKIPTILKVGKKYKAFL